MIDVMSLDPPPVGVRVLRFADEYAETEPFTGVSYCQAVRLAGEGAALRVMAGSMEVCRWAPVVLGLKPPDGHFEEHLAPRLAFPTQGLLLAPLARFPGEPDVVLVRARRQVLESLVRAVGRDRLWQGHGGRLAWSVVPLFAGGSVTLHYRAIGKANALFASLARSKSWQAATHRLFRSCLVTAAYDAVISRTLADMSVCRNSTVIPLQSGRVNVSFFCSGGITWGLNNPNHLTSGWPWPVFRGLVSRAS